MRKPDWKMLIFFIAVSLGVGALSSLLTTDSRQQYAALKQPPLAPPGWIFPIVWTILFVLMGIAAYLVFEADIPEKQRQKALLCYGGQLFANLLWSVIFFRFDTYVLAFCWLVFLWYLIYRNIRLFLAVDVRAGKLLIPYLIWVTFAGYLNLTIAIMNW